MVLAHPCLAFTPLVPDEIKLLLAALKLTAKDKTKAMKSAWNPLPQRLHPDRRALTKRRAGPQLGTPKSYSKETQGSSTSRLNLHLYTPTLTTSCVTQKAR